MLRLCASLLSAVMFAVLAEMFVSFVPMAVVFAVMLSRFALTCVSSAVRFAAVVFAVFT